MSVYFTILLLISALSILIFYFLFLNLEQRAFGKRYAFCLLPFTCTLSLVGLVLIRRGAVSSDQNPVVTIFLANALEVLLPLAAFLSVFVLSSNWLRQPNVGLSRIKIALGTGLLIACFRAFSHFLVGLSEWNSLAQSLEHFQKMDVTLWMLTFSALWELARISILYSAFFSVFMWVKDGDDQRASRGESSHLAQTLTVASVVMVMFIVMSRVGLMYLLARTITMGDASTTWMVQTVMFTNDILIPGAILYSVTKLGSKNLRSGIFTNREKNEAVAI